MMTTISSSDEAESQKNRDKTVPVVLPAFILYI